MSITFLEKRVLSYLVDYAISFVIAVLIVLFSNIFDFINLPFLNNATRVLTSATFVYFFISLLSLLIFKGRSIGRMLTRLQVKSIDGSDLGFFQVLIRSLSESLFILALISVFYVLHYQNGYSIFDKVSDTKVISI